MREDLIDKLGIKTSQTKLNVSTMTNMNHNQITRVVNNLEIKSIDGTYSTLIPVVYTRKAESWPFSREDLVRLRDLEDLPHLKEVPIKEVDEDVGLLIGMNAPDLLKEIEVVDGDAGLPYATLHKLGWVISGPIGRSNLSQIEIVIKLMWFLIIV